MSDPIERLVRAVNLLEIAEDQILEARTELLRIGAVESATELKMLRFAGDLDDVTRAIEHLERELRMQEAQRQYDQWEWEREQQREWQRAQQWQRDHSHDWLDKYIE